MIQITPQIPILVAEESVELQKGIDSLAELCRQKLIHFRATCSCSGAGEQPQ
jgi:hypothetical protein